MDVSLNAGLTFSPPWLGPPQPTAIRTKRPNLLILHPSSLLLLLLLLPLQWYAALLLKKLYQVYYLRLFTHRSSPSPLCETDPIIILPHSIQLTVCPSSNWTILHFLNGLDGDDYTGDDNLDGLECLFEWLAGGCYVKRV